MDPVEGEGMYKTFIFKYIQKKDIPSVIQHASENLFDSMRCLGYEDHLEEDFQNLYKSFLESNQSLSFIAIDTETGKIAGLRMIILVNKSDQEEKFELEAFKFDQSRQIFAYILALSKQCNVWELYPEVDKFAEFYGISVIPEHRNKGLATEIYKRTLAMLKLRGLSVARSGFTNPFSRKAAFNLGFKALVKEMCSEAKNSEGKLINPNADPEDFFDYGVFEF